MPEEEQNIVVAQTQENTVLPGEVREGLRITFDKTLDKMQSLVDKVGVLAQQAENYFWTFRATALRSVLASENGTADLLNECATGAQKLCSAAYPMLNEILVNMHYLSGVTATYVALGQATVTEGSPSTFVMDCLDDTIWYDIEDSGHNVLGSPTRTFYLPTVREVCTSLTQYITQMREWNKNTEGWSNVNSIGIRDIYGEALIDMYARTRKVINLLGPLFPPVICNYYPAVTAPMGVGGNVENFLPTQCILVRRNTQYFELQIKSASYILPMSEVIGFEYDDPVEKAAYVADYVTTPVETDGGKIYPSRGGIISIEQLDATSDDGTTVDVTGVYEIYEVQDEAGGGNLILSNEKLINSNLDSSVLDSIYGTSFVLRLIRKAEPDTEGKIHVQYRADMDLLDTDHFEQEFSWEFDNTGVNQHSTPMAKNSTTGIFVWKQYSQSVNGDEVPRGVEINNLDEDTVFIGNLVDRIGMSGQVYAFSMDATYLYIGGDFDTVQGLGINNLVRVTLASGNVDTWIPEPNGVVRTIAIDGAGNIYVGGTFTEIAGETRSNLAKFNSSGILQAWAPDPNGTVYAVGVDSYGNIVVGGSFDTINGITRCNLAIFNSSDVLQSWNPNPNGTVFALAEDSLQNVFVGGSFTFIGGHPIERLAKFDSNRTIVSGWSPNPNGTVRAIAVDGSDNLYIGGDFTIVNGASHHLAKFDSSGNPGTPYSYYPDFSPTGTVFALAVDSNGNLYVGGSFDAVETVTRRGFAVFNSSHVLQPLNPAPGVVFSFLVFETDTTVPPDGIMDTLKLFSGTWSRAFLYNGTNFLPVPGWV